MPVWFSSVLKNKPANGKRWLQWPALLIFCLGNSLAYAQFGGSGSSLFDDQPRFLPVDEAFPHFLSLDSSHQVSLHWDVADGYYLYREQFEFSLTEQDHGEIRVELPAGEAHHDVYFGDVEVYYGRLRVRLILPEDLPAEQAGTLRLRFQGCAEAGLCYPPETREVEIPPRMAR